MYSAQVSNLSVVVFRRSRHPLPFLWTASVPRAPSPWIGTSLGTLTLTDGFLDNRLCHTCHPSACHHDILSSCHRILDDRRVCRQARDLRPYRRHANFVWAGLRPSGSPWLYCLHRSLSPPDPVDSLQQSVSHGRPHQIRTLHLSSYAGHRR